MTTNLRYQHITVGQTIRAYDHEPCPGRPRIYVEGEVIEHTTSPTEGWAALAIKCDKDTQVPEGDECSRVGQVVLVPMEMLFDDRWSEDRVSVIERMDGVKAARISAAIVSHIDAGMEPADAVDLVLGRGTYQQIASDLYDAFQERGVA